MLCGRICTGQRSAPSASSAASGGTAPGGREIFERSSFDRYGRGHLETDMGEVILRQLWERSYLDINGRGPHET